MCVLVVKHSNAGRLRQEGTLHSAQLRGLHNWHSDQRKAHFFSGCCTRWKWTFNHAIPIISRTCFDYFKCILQQSSCECCDLISTHVLLAQL